MVTYDDDHQCPWRDEAKRLAAEVEELKQRFALLERRLLGPKTEKMPPMRGEVAKERPSNPEAAKQKRRGAAAEKAKLQTEIVDLPVPPSQR